MVGLQNQWMESLHEVKHAAATQIVSDVGDGAKADLLPEQKRTDYSVKWPRIGGHVNFGECSRTQSLQNGWKSPVTDLQEVGAIS